MPKKDTDGFRYTKEEAIEIFATEFQKRIDNGSYAYTSAIDDTKVYGWYSQESFEASLKILMTDPYSSERLARTFDIYRKTGNIGVLIGEASIWLSMDGDKGNEKIQ
ncbi:MAG: hypothetical protein GX625_13410 [Clostridiaceae bacterium]|nr:hypothetical protein [Clostridiaceae bacterium]